jgi:hypothetical protein|eukprot:scaffold1026_cov164-Alexandrium_tamarense.AAC.10
MEETTLFCGAMNARHELDVAKRARRAEESVLMMYVSTVVSRERHDEQRAVFGGTSGWSVGDFVRQLWRRRRAR